MHAMISASTQKQNEPTTHSSAKVEGRRAYDFTGGLGTLRGAGGPPGPPGGKHHLSLPASAGSVVLGVLNT